MSKNRCYLCGGKLLNGRCQDCGLDNARSQNKKYRLNQSGLDYKIKSRQQEKDALRHKEKDDEVYKDKIENAKPEVHMPKAQKAVPKFGYSSIGGNNSVTKKKSKQVAASKKNYKIIVTIIGVIAVLARPISDFISEQKADAVNVSQKGTAQVEEYDPYEFATRELAADGDSFESELEPGQYKVGVHLPEGNYKVSLAEGNGTVTVDDYENSIYLWQSIGEDKENDELQEWEDVRLYQGAKLEVRGDVRVRMSTESAQSTKLASLQVNPLSESFLLKKGEEVTAGAEFPEGVYDLEATSEWSSVSYSVPLYTDYEDEELNFLNKSILIATDALDSRYRNVVIPAGTTVVSEDADVMLVPSEWIETEDYDSYYDEYRY